jgi:HNH endonuclease
MTHDLLIAAAARSNVDLVARLQNLAGRSREDTAEMVAHLAELEARRIHLAEGYGSLFTYCTTALRLSEHEAYNRMVAAQAAPRFPAILDGLADGSLNMTTVRLLAPHLTPENSRDVLTRAAGRSKREIQALVASLAPKPDVAPSIRKMPAPTDDAASASQKASPDTLAASLTAGGDATPLPSTQANETAPDPPVSAPMAAPRPIVAPLSATRYRVQFTVDAETHDELRLAQDLLRREIPNGDPGAIFTKALKLLLARVMKEKTAAVAAPRPAPPSDPGSRHIPASVKRAVWGRDRGQCAFVAGEGRRCTERAFLEFHHIRPFALGGEKTVSNIALRCRRHNAYEAELDFGLPRTRSGTG